LVFRTFMKELDRELSNFRRRRALWLHSVSSLPRYRRMMERYRIGQDKKKRGRLPTDLLRFTLPIAINKQRPRKAQTLVPIDSCYIRIWWVSVASSTALTQYMSCMFPKNKTNIHLFEKIVPIYLEIDSIMSIGNILLLLFPIFSLIFYIWRGLSNSCFSFALTLEFNHVKKFFSDETRT